LYGLIAFVVAVAIGAAIIMLATRLVAGFTPKFLSAAIAALVASIAGAVVSFGLQMVLGAGGLSSLLVVVIYFLLNSAIINALIKRPDGSQMGFVKAALVTLLVDVPLHAVAAVVAAQVADLGRVARVRARDHGAQAG